LRISNIISTDVFKDTRPSFNMLNLSKQQLTRIEKTTQNLPTEDILSQYQKIHEDLLTHFFVLRHQSILLGECLKARFGGGGGNPAERALKRGEIHEYEYQVIWALVDCYQTIFTLIQMNWESISQLLCFESEVSLFLEILREHYDGQFKRCFKSHNYTSQHAQQQARILKKMTGALATEAPLVEMTPQERKKAGLPKETNYFSWLPLILQIAQDNCKKNPHMKRYYNKCWEELSRLADIHEYWTNNHRGESRAKAVRWKDGQFSIGTQGGYKPMPLTYACNVTKS
jgi:hypothetical protein